MKLQRPIFVGTFHKTGTVLMAGIFRSAARKLDLVFWPLYESKPKFKDAAEYAPPNLHWDICFDGHSRFLKSKRLFGADALGVISIRDPRDVIVSSAAFHCKSTEPWLHAPRRKFGGKTYQQVICALPNENARLLFEMENRAKQTIDEMLGIEQGDPRLLITRLETLMTDVDFLEYRKLFSFLGFEGPSLEVCLGVARAHSIFSGKAKRAGHVQHGRGAIWKDRFTPEIAAEFERRFPGAAERLGYEPTLVD